MKKIMKKKEYIISYGEEERIRNKEKEKLIIQ